MTEINEAIKDAKQICDGKKDRNWAFTLFDYTEEERLAILAMPAEWVIIGKEVCPDTKRLHLQGFFALKHQKTFSALKKFQPRWHLAKKYPRATFLQNFEYCSKGGDFEERGTRPSDPKGKGDAEKRRWDEAFEAVKEGRIDDVPNDIKCRHLKGIEYAVAKSTAPTKLATLATLDNEWRYGDPQSGKSEGARAENPSLFVKLARSKWFDGYAYENAVLVEDIDPESAKAAQFIKVLADKYPCPVEVKGGTMMIRPQRVIVTSNYHPRDIFSGIDLVAIERRFKVIHFVHNPHFSRQATGEARSRASDEVAPPEK